DRARLVELFVRLAHLVWEVRVERQLERHLDDRHRDNPRAALACEAARDVHRLVRRIAGSNGHEDAAVLELRADDDDRSADRLLERLAAIAAIERIEDETEREPAEAGITRRRVLLHDDEPGDSGAEAAHDREDRPVDPADSDARARAPDLLLAALADAQCCD